MAADDLLLSVRGLQVEFDTSQGRFTALHGIDFDLGRGRVLGIVGESGSGKSVTALSVLRLLPDDTARIVAGRVLFGGMDLAQCNDRQMRSVRGRQIGMIFQDPTTSLNPIFSIGHQLKEGLRLHLGLGRAAAARRAEELLALVRIAGPRECMAKYPHELSGGMRQRVMIAIALSCSPTLLIADEPTTALDVTTQAQILELLRDVQGEFGMAIMLITHDLGVVAEFADEVQVMYAGRIVERAPADQLFIQQRHPYTEGLLHSMPSLDEPDPDQLPTIQGMVAAPFALPPGCAFQPRCPYAWDACAACIPALDPAGPGRAAACLRNAAGYRDGGSI